MAVNPMFEQLASQAIPIHRWLGLTLRVGSVDGTHAEGWANAELPFRDEIVGGPRRPALHGCIAEAQTVRKGSRVAVVDIRCWQANKPETLVGAGTGVYNIKRKGD